MKYPIKMFDEETILIDNIFAAKEAFEYAKKHNFNARFNETSSQDSIGIMKLFQDAGYSITLADEEMSAPDGTVLKPKIVAVFEKKEELEKITVEEYNKVYLPKNRSGICHQHL